MCKNIGVPTVIFGTGGAAKETYYSIKQVVKAQNNKDEIAVIGFVEQDMERVGETIFDKQSIVACDKSLDKYVEKFDCWAAIISIADSKIKKSIYERVSTFKNMVLPNIIHPSVIYEESLLIKGVGNIILAGTVANCEIRIGTCNIINRSCTIGHDVEIGDFNTINPMVCISGDVKIGDNCLIGAGSIILQGITIGNNVIIGAGSVVTKDIYDGEKVVGVPARPVQN